MIYVIGGFDWMENLVAVKLGYSSDVGARLSALQIASPLRLRVLATRPGTVEDEMRLHERHALHRLRGEWYEPDPEVLEEASCGLHEPLEDSEAQCSADRDVLDAPARASRSAALDAAEQIVSLLRGLPTDPPSEGARALRLAEGIRALIQAAVVDTWISRLGGISPTGDPWGATAAARALGVELRSLQRWRSRRNDCEV